MSVYVKIANLKEQDNGYVQSASFSFCLFREALRMTHSPRQLHPVLRIECAEKDRFTTGQKNNFFLMFDECVLGRSEINCFL